MNEARSLAAAVRDVLLPPRCAGCGTAGAPFCATCAGEYEPVTVHVTLSLVVRAAGEYGGPLREAIHRLKYAGERALAGELGSLLAAVVAADVARGAALDAIVPVPLHRARAAARGFDQSRLLARAVASRCGLPIVDALHRVRAGAPQVELDRAARADNLRGAFVAVAGELRGLSVALVDDVATTGATLRAAASAARAAGARAARAYVVAADA